MLKAKHHCTIEVNRRREGIDYLQIVLKTLLMIGTSLAPSKVGSLREGPFSH